MPKHAQPTLPANAQLVLPNRSRWPTGWPWLLGLIYAGVVLGLGRLLGRDSSLVVAAATLAVAAGFSPLRRRVQGLVDRRFNRRRYDAARAVVAFAARLRDQVDLDALSAELLAVVHHTMQPVEASLWLRLQAPPPAPETTH